MLVMIYEHLRGADSPWSAYFAVLPTHFDSPMFWSEDELAELQGSEIVHMVGKASAEDAILEHLAPVIRQHSQHFPGVPAEEDAANKMVLTLAHRMGSLIKAYAFDIATDDDGEEKEGEDGYVTDEEESQQPPKGMVPYADLLNADADRNNVCLARSCTLNYI